MASGSRPATRFPPHSSASSISGHAEIDRFGKHAQIAVQLVAADLAPRLPGALANRFEGERAVANPDRQLAQGNWFQSVGCAQEVENDLCRPVD